MATLNKKHAVTAQISFGSMVRVDNGNVKCFILKNTPAYCAIDSNLRELSRWRIFDAVEKVSNKKIPSLLKKSKRCIPDLFWIQFFRNLFNRDIQSFDESKRKRKGLSKTRTMNKSARDSGSQASQWNSNWRHKVLDKDLVLRTISLSANVRLAECSH